MLKGHYPGFNGNVIFAKSLMRSPSCFSCLNKGTEQRVAQSQLEARSFSSCPPPDLRGLSKCNDIPNELPTTLERGLSMNPTGWWSHYSRYRRERGPSSPTLLATSPRHANDGMRAMYVFLPTATFNTRSDLVPFCRGAFCTSDDS